MNRAFKITNPTIRAERAQHKRELGAPQISRDTQAQRYAAFLLSREGIEAEPDQISVYLQAVKIDGRATKRAWSYSYQGKSYAFPHRAYVPAEPIHEMAD